MSPPVLESSLPCRQWALFCGRALLTFSDPPPTVLPAPAQPPADHRPQPPAARPLLVLWPARRHRKKPDGKKQSEKLRRKLMRYCFSSFAFAVVWCSGIV